MDTILPHNNCDKNAIIVNALTSSLKNQGATILSNYVTYKLVLTSKLWFKMIKNIH